MKTRVAGSNEVDSKVGSNRSWFESKMRRRGVGRWRWVQIWVEVGFESKLGWRLGDDDGDGFEVSKERRQVQVSMGFGSKLVGGLDLVFGSKVKSAKARSG